MMIRLISPMDAEELFLLVDENRNYLRKWLPWLDHNITVDDTREFIRTSLCEYEEQRSMIHVIVDEGRICGVCGFNSINRTIKAGFIGYWISQQSQGKGLISKACIALETIGFDRLELNKIEIHIAQENASSRAVAEGLNYQNTGIILDAEWLYNHYVDHAIYCKLNPERVSQ